MTIDEKVFVGCLVAAAFVAGMEMPVCAKTFDEKKWEALERNREVRRANERRTQMCANQCMETCK